MLLLYIYVVCKLIFLVLLLIWMLMGLFFYLHRIVQEVLPPTLDSTSQPPSLFDETTRLYINYQCPYSQRVWITRNVKGLQDKIKLVPIDLKNRPDWYKEKVYPTNKVPSLEHNNKVIGESLDLVNYVDSNFEGPSFLPDDPEKRKFAEELIAYSDTTFVPEVYRSFAKDARTLAGAQFDYLEKALLKFDDGPFFLGQFSQVDIAYAPFIERFQVFMPEGFDYDITTGRPKLANGLSDSVNFKDSGLVHFSCIIHVLYIEGQPWNNNKVVSVLLEMNKLDGYKQTKVLEKEKMVEYYKNRFLPNLFSPLQLQKKSASMAFLIVQEVLPPTLDSTSQPPSLFDETTRLYINYQCPYSQRVWITRNVKGLQDKIKLVPIDLKNRPDWYKEKVYPTNKVPSLEHNNKVIGESLDLVNYVDSNFEGPSFLPDDPEKRKFAEELIAYSDTTFVPEVYRSFAKDARTLAGAQFDYLEKPLLKFDDGPFFLGQFSQVDIAYAPFIERFEVFMTEGLDYDITTGRPKLAKWIEEMNKLDRYKQTKVLEQEKMVEYYKNRFLPEMNKFDGYKQTKVFEQEKMVEYYKNCFLL
ncbi:hypothetical protein H5410_044911, partial [Solanum commersonii]